MKRFLFTSVYQREMLDLLFRNSETEESGISALAEPVVASRLPLEIIGGTSFARLHGLTTAVFNGMIGTVISFDEAADR